ncbi:Gfo/Idh/MocA family oxidoreductase [Croceicoccus ponticola]|uniref:Gfo/Idh/MocA family oxidoreductase n=1 Tax=Croceicoccus ponticola TaxID=2217664 RepID=A0A437GXK4_9SPHN|nr:Gfo/Idh/MocA family oxidoreductase [Croceicoccus ponticola]RVQ67100.1 Gfo/Idh/MocA family oxidoreductase [Croceicoccus ponticola]
MGRIGVGLIGYEVGRSWAAMAHVPALRGLPEFEIVAVSTTREESARAAATDIGIDRWFTSAQDLAACPQVDLVAVTVKVPHHLALVEAAIAAGKHVYCEWPLGNGLAEAEAMAAHVSAAGVRGVVGLQARCAPVMAYVRDIVAAGEIGEVLSTTMLGSGQEWADRVDPYNAYLIDKRNGATMLTIPFGHTVDALCHCLGEFRQVSATSAIRQPFVRRTDTDEMLGKTSEDQWAVTGTLESGAVATVHYRAGSSRSVNFLWEINGTKGDLRIEADSGHAQIFDLRLYGGFGEERAVRALDVPAHYRWVPPGIEGAGTNVAQVYARFADDLRNGTRTAPDFAVAVMRHRLIAAIEAAAESGRATQV